MTPDRVIYSNCLCTGVTEDRGQPEDFGDLSDEEIQTFSQEIVESIPEMMSEVLGKDLEADFDPEDQVVNEIEQIFMQFRDAAQAESEEERSEKMMHILDESAAQAFSQMDFIEGSEKEGLEALIEYHEESFEDGYDLIESWGYEEYLEKVDGLAVELIEDGKDQKVTALYEDEVDRNTGMMQRLIDPLFEEYLPLLEDSDIKDADEVRKYQDMYEETAELYAGLLPEFIAVLQIKKVGNHEYEELKNYSLNNLLQKLNSKNSPSIISSLGV